MKLRDKDAGRWARRVVGAMTGLAVALACGAGARAQSVTGGSGPEFSIVVIPDSQYLTGNTTRHGTNLWLDQVDWIIQHAAPYNIKAVLHLGDLVDNADERQLRNAMAGLNLLRAAGCPLIIAPGNHDCDSGSSRPQRLMNMASNGLAPGWFSNYANFGRGWTMGFQNPSNLLGSYLLFTNGAQPYLITALAWLPNQTTMLWASNVAASHGDVPCIYAQHPFVDSDPAGMRLSWDSVWSVERAFGDASPWLTPNQMWDRWLSGTRNVFWIASGHTIPYEVNHKMAGRNCNFLTDKAADGHNVLQTLCDFQNYEGTIGEGTNYLQLVRFFPEKNQAEMSIIAPTKAVPLQPAQREVFAWTPFSTGTATNTKWQAAVRDPSHLLLYLNFEEADGFRDLSPFGANIVNSNETVRPTSLGRSLWVTNTDTNYLTVGASWRQIKAGSAEKAELNQFADLRAATFSVWFNTTNLDTVGTASVLISKFDAGTRGDWYLGFDNATTAHFVTVNARGARVNLTAKVPAVTDGAWRHCVGVYDGVEDDGYLDNVCYGSAAQSGVLRMTPLPVTVGPDNTLQARGINGYEDEIKILGVAWTAEEVSQEYQRVRALLGAGKQ